MPWVRLDDSPIVQYQALSRHSLKDAYFRCPMGMAHINYIDIFNLYEREI